MPHLEEITYDLGRAALADQESVVSGIRSRTSTLVATQALVASFLGGAAIDRGSLGFCGWSAIAMLMIGLALSVVVLAPWRMRFSLDPRSIYADLADEAAAGRLDWLVIAGFIHEDLCERNRGRVDRLVMLLLLISIATMMELLLWIAAVALR
ncbi:hypothetical protein [Baekduia sp. Peel2402]|uniref:hypothetical protein n=1 Tax=Baekduia sp. Peel2402 TaxID=3458296 RepID=UPI00403EF16C